MKGIDKGWRILKKYGIIEEKIKIKKVIKMADAVLSVRIDEELKQRFMELAQENGVNNKELMEVLVSQFELGQMGDGTAQFNQDIEELQRITKRMNEIYLHLVERTQLKLLEMKNKDQSFKHEQEEKIQQLEERLKLIEEKDKELQKMKDQLRLKEIEFKGFQDESTSLKDLNGLLREKNSQLEKQMAESKAKLEAAQEVLEEVAKLRAVNQDQETLIKHQGYQLEKERKEKEDLKVMFESEQVKIRQALEHEWELERRTQQLEVEELKMTIKREYSEQIENLKVQYQEKIERLIREKQEMLGRIGVVEN